MFQCAKLNIKNSLLLVLALSIITNSHAQDVAAVFEQVAQSVVEVRASYFIVSGTKEKQTSIVENQGSGVVISNDGKVITVAHLVQSADKITVHTVNGEAISARVIASEPAADIALLQLGNTPAGISPATLGNSDEVKTGQQAFIIGAPYGLYPTVTVGYINGRQYPQPPFGPFQPNEIIQTDAGMHQGSSGAPLFNLHGQVIGIATKIMTTKGSYDGLGFAVSVNTAKSLLLERPSLWTGIECYWLSGGLAQALNVPQSSGLLVQRIASHSPASKLVLQAGTAPSVVGEDKFILGGDVILSMQHISLADERGYEQARAALANLKNGEVMHVTVLRAGKQIELHAPVSR